MGQFFSLWEDARLLAEPCCRIGGPEIGGLTFNTNSWAPGEDELYIALFEGLASRLPCDLFVSTMDDENRRSMARMLDPLETIAVPLEWDDHRFHVLGEQEFEQGEPQEYSTVCFSSPGKSPRQALNWLWGTQSEFWFPLLGILPRTRHTLSRWNSVRLAQEDARNIILQIYEGLLFIGCPRELYVSGGTHVVGPLVQVMSELEERLTQHGWIENARSQVVSSESGTYYHADDPRATSVELVGHLSDLAVPR
jgi:hypothetical protein